MSKSRFLNQRLQMRQLRLVKVVAEQGSLSAAARYLGLSQPALTKSLQELERVVGEVLFERASSGVRPTVSGAMLMQFAGRILAEVDRLSDQLDRQAAPGEGLVVLGALPVTAAGLLPRLVLDLRQAHPLLELRLVVARTEELVSRLLAGELDLVMGRLYPTEVPDGLRREVLYQEPISVLARSDHSICSVAAPSVADLAAWDLILPTFGQRLGREIEHIIVDLGLSASPRLLRSTSHLLIRELLHESDMLTIAPRMLVAGDILRGSLRVVPIALPGGARPAGLITAPNRPLAPSAELVRAAMRAAIHSLGQEARSITSGYGGSGIIDEAISKLTS